MIKYIIISWFIVGLAATIWAVLRDIVSKSFKRDKLDKEYIMFVIGSILLGYITAFIFICIFLADDIIYVIDKKNKKYPLNIGSI